MSYFIVRECVCGSRGDVKEVSETDFEKELAEDQDGKGAVSMVGENDYITYQKNSCKFCVSEMEAEE